MKRVLWLVLVIQGCPVDHSRDPWLPHQPTAWVLTPGGHLRDAGPFKSVAEGFLTESQIDAAVDFGFSDFLTTFAPLIQNLVLTENRVALNDDYVMYVPNAGWAGGVEYIQNLPVTVCLWSRGTSATDPGAEFIKRPPGADGFGYTYPYWRFTGLPLCPAIKHELLHTVIGDPGHTSPLWKFAG